MTKYSGNAVGNKVVIGNVWKRVGTGAVTRQQGAGVDTECSRFEEACALAEAQLIELAKQEITSLHGQGEGIFEGLRLILRDAGFRERILQKIQVDNCSAEYAVFLVCENYANTFREMSDAYMQARAVDFRDLRARLLTALQGEAPMDCPDAFILVAKELTSSDVMSVDRNRVLAMVSLEGTTYSHGAILAAALDIPAIFGVDLDWDDVQNGDLMIVDEVEAQVILRPDEKVVKTMQNKQVCDDKKMKSVIGMKAITKGGKSIRLCANAGSLAEVEAAIRNDAEGIGLFRSELLYLNSSTLPDENQQYEIYKTILEMMAGKSVTIRTLDLGGDKKASCLDLPCEENPALGYRAIRICLDRKELFITQLKALLRAACYGDLSIMYPMITSVEEVRAIKGTLEEAAGELQKEGIPYKLPRQGIMIETPAAVMVSDELAAEVDFFSIGTNDLTQFTLAADRLNKNVQSVYNPYHPAIKRMIRMTVESGHRQGIPVGICGELASDNKMTGEFLKWGVDELSMVPSGILPVKRTILEME